MDFRDKVYSCTIIVHLWTIVQAPVPWVNLGFYLKHHFHCLFHEGIVWEKTTCMNLRKMVDNHTVISPVEDKMGYDVLHGKLSETWKGCYDRSILRLNNSCNLIPYYMYIYITYVHIYVIWHTGHQTLDTHYSISRSVSCTKRNYRHCLPLLVTFATQHVNYLL